LSTWLTQLDGLTSGDGIAVISATNRKDLLDQAMLDRLSSMEFHIGRPRLSAAREIFAVHLPETLPYRVNGMDARAVRQQLIDTAVDRLYSPNAGNDVATLRFRDGTSRTVGAHELISGRLISQMASAARISAFQRHATRGEPGLAAADIHDAVSDVLDRLASTLTIRNARDYLSDLPQDVDLVAVDSHRRKVRRDRWIDPGAYDG
jgi:SpoVK/Ycf46/Vps4 family AAA+-type ATPase